jgi:hypothetical protein
VKSDALYALREFPLPHRFPACTRSMSLFSVLDAIAQAIYSVVFLFFTYSTWVLTATATTKTTTMMAISVE